MPSGKQTSSGACENSRFHILFVRVWHGPIPPYIIIRMGTAGRKPVRMERIKWKSICNLLIHLSPSIGVWGETPCSPTALDLGCAERRHIWQARYGRAFKPPPSGACDSQKTGEHVPPDKPVSGAACGIGRFRCLMNRVPPSAGARAAGTGCANIRPLSN